MQNLVLLVEDSKEIYQMVSNALETPILKLVWADSLNRANSLIQENEFDLILIDIELPDGSGIDLCTQLQADSPNIPIFFLTGHSDLSEKVLGFSAGADDYITKPFNSLELKARVEAKLKKVQILTQTSDELIWERLKINKLSQEVQVFNVGNFESIELTALEFKILMYFATRPDVVIERDEVLNEIWGRDIHVYSRSVDTHISKLRKKLGPVSSMIESVHGVGYKFVPN